MDQVIVFDKSLQQRRNEYLDALSEQELLPASKIKKVWSFYLELSLDPNGWQAVWKIPRLTCELLKISFPTIVLVGVESIDCNSLCAEVKILAVQDDISLADKHEVPLINLWPTKEQDKTVALNIDQTANTLDMYRFFYSNVFMPWDYEDDDVSDWLSKHLVSRLRLYYDIKNGVIPRATADRILSLFVEARRMQSMKENVEADIDDDCYDDLDINSDIKDKRVQKLMNIHLHMIKIRNEIEILENPLMRNIALQQEEELYPSKESASPKVWLLFDIGKVDDYIQFLNHVKLYYPNDTVSFTSHLMCVNSCDTVILSNSKHAITSGGGLEQGGILKGIYDRSDTIISSMKEDDMLDFSGEVLLENLTFNAQLSQCGILVRDGKVTVKNCNLIGDGTSSTHQGIIVLDGNMLELIDCDISGFSTAIVGNSGSKIAITNCKIHDVTFGIKAYSNCTITVQNSVFSNCRDYAFNVEVNEIEGQKIGNFDVLQMVCNITFQDLSGENNGKADVMINHKHRIRPLESLFSSIDWVCDEEMELSNDNLNNTVIENNGPSE